jgi:predicted O-linked N-acetylglucosamine transferase (SPINDLY family)
MKARITGKKSAPVFREQAEAALAAWHGGAATPDSVLPLLRRAATTAVDYSNLGAVLRTTGRQQDAETAYRKAIALDPRFPTAHYNLGNLLVGSGRLDAAADAYRTALRLKPDYAEAWNSLGTALQRRGHMQGAADAFRQATRHAPGWAEAQTNLGVALLGVEQYDASERAFEAALALDPEHAAAYGNLGALLLRAGRPVAAERASRQAIALAPQEHRWVANLAVALQSQGRHEETEACCRQALALRPDYPTGHGNLLFALNYRHDLSAEAIFAEYRQWDTRHARPLRPPAPTYVLKPTHGRRLRIGYVSPDFRTHAVSLFSEPVLAAHDRSLVELFLYAEVPIEDETTARFKALADHWRSTVGRDDGEVAGMIRQDGIDVLVDLGGHTGGSRLLVFARKPAPVQIAWLVGHGYTSGLSAMDAFLADAILVPPDADGLFSERVIRLPRIPLVYQPPEKMPPVAPLPAVTNGYVTFGYFGRPERLNPDVIAAWSRILHAVPNSRLVLNNRGFQETAFCELFAARFAEHRIARTQLEMTYTAPQPCTWVAYGAIDIALDPFPHNAGTTTIEALWQGVPVVTFASRPSVGRFGACILHALGMDDWVAADVDAYVARAVTAAGDLAALAETRAALRPRFEASPLRDGTSLARNLEAVYRTLREQVQPDDLRQRFQAGDFAGANRLATETLARDPANAGAAHVAGLIAHREKRLADAERFLRIAVAGSPTDPEPHANHAAILRALGRLDAAERAARAALAIAPDRLETHNNLGNILRDAGRYDESIACFHIALARDPTFADGWANLAWVESLAGRAKEAEHAARQAIRHDPDHANGHNNLGLALMRQSRLREAETTLRRALALKPDFPLAHSNILFCLNYRDDLTAEQIFAEYRDWDMRHGRALPPPSPTFDLDRTPKRRLRVGYVSPDFRHHAVALFAEPLLAAHDHGDIELFCYAEVASGDATTERFRAMADHWRSTVGMTDAAVAELIRRDRIDVLVDLAGHTAGNRLLAFARKPAPVQIEFMLGHGYTSGLSAMDAFLADPVLAPPEADALFTERVVRMPRLPLAYQPPEGVPPVAPLPALRTGRVTFGYFGRTVRLNDGVLAAWARILTEIPTARLVLNSAPLAEPAGKQEMERRFAALGISAERVDLICTSPQPRTWAAYGAIDIALDPFPHNAGTTTIEALWQGVPVVSLAGRPTVGRFGAAILHAVGLDDWVATDVDGYVALAVTAAADLPALAALRAGLRPRFAASPLHDATSLAREIEVAYRALWDEWRVDRPRDLYAQGKRAEASALSERLLQRNPTHADALHVLGIDAWMSGDGARAVTLLSRAPPRADILTDLGVMLRSQGKLADAEAAYRRALSLDPDLVQALGNLGNVLLDLHRPVEAEAAFSQGLSANPDSPWLLRGLALALLAQDKAGVAEASLRRAVAVAPENADAHETLGALLGQTGRPVEAETHHRIALPRLKDQARCLSNLALALQTQGRHRDAESCLRQALALRPDYASGHSNLLFALNYRDDLAAETIFEEYRQWNARHAQAAAAPRFVNDPDPDRRLRVGYVSPDFRQHSVALFAEPLLAAHDRAAIELFCYGEVAIEDSTTSRIRGLADHWRSTVGLNDEAMVSLIRDDRIDVLVDLAGHTGGSRLPVFGRRAAPVQVESILGHGYTSGLTAMDGFLADETLAPPGTDSLFSERLIRLPRIPLVYQPPENMPEVARLPAIANGFVTFGYFGRPDRLNDSVIGVWSRILATVPGSRLMLNSRAFGEVAFRALYAGRFAAHGIGAERLMMIATAPQPATWAAYGAIDVALDPFPHNGGTTTLEALWLGVPVISRTARPTVGRFGASILQAVGLPALVAETDDGYVAAAAGIAGDLAALAGLRAGLRARMETSPLRDATGLARVVEDAYRSLWRDWCGQAVTAAAA